MSLPLAQTSERSDGPSATLPRVGLQVDSIDEVTLNEETKQSSNPVSETRPNTKKDWRFWAIFLSLCISSFLAAIDLTSVSTALPVIAQDLDSTDYTWIGSAYALTSTAFLPWTGGLASVFGRRSVLVSALLIFAIGSALAGAAQNMSMMIAGRSIQGIGGGAILSMSEIVVSDLVPLSQRGAYFGILGAVWAVASAIGPPVGGAFAERNWRWLFYMNIPIAGLAMVLVILFLTLKVPKEDLVSKFKRIDWFGNALIIASTTSALIGLTWAGSTYSWASYQVLVPLILGLAGMVAFVFFERYFVTEPTLPWEILRNWTSVVGYLATFLHGVIVMAFIYFYPVYFQAVKSVGPVQSGVDLFSFSFTIAPMAIITGVWVTVSKTYWWQNQVGWVFIIIGCGLMSLIVADSSKTAWAGLPIVLGMGFGMLFAATTFPVLAPTPIEKTAHAMAFFTFTRSFGQAWGITIGSTAVQNELKKRLPSAFLSSLGNSGASLAYASIGSIPLLPEPLQSEVKVAFADTLRVLWRALIPVAGVAFLISLTMKSLPLPEVTDEEWGMDDREKASSGQGPTSDLEKADV